jgi:DNA recombination protein RmuC
MPGREELQQCVEQSAARHGERLERGLRQELGEGARSSRQELAQNLATFQDAVTRQSAEAVRTQNAQVDALAAQLMQLRGTLGDTLVAQLQALGLTMTQQAQETTRTQNAQIDAFAQQLAQLRGGLSQTLTEQLQQLSEANARRIAEMRATLEQQLGTLQASNSAKLDEMRQTVDEKLHATLEQRLGESFKQVAERLEQVHKGLGEMQTLAQGVGDLKHLLANVKTRGLFGEAQLGQLLEQVFTPEQYAAQVGTRPGSKERVDFAIRLPGAAKTARRCGCRSTPSFRPRTTSACWTPSSAPTRRRRGCGPRAGGAHPPGGAQHGRQVLEPPHTTDFAILFLPTEGLYAEVLRRPGLMQALQREHRVTLAGPTTLLAMLSSLQMGFRTLALEQRSSQVWQVLGAVKTEFGKFGQFVAKVKDQAEGVVKTLDAAQTRTNMMNRALKTVEALPEAQTQALLPAAEPDAEA